MKDHRLFYWSKNKIEVPPPSRLITQDKMSTTDLRTKRYEKLMLRAVDRMIDSNETEAVAESAIKAYVASLDNDYKTMWEETDWMLLRAKCEIQRLKNEIRLKDLELNKERSSEREVELIKRFHGIKG